MLHFAKSRSLIASVITATMLICPAIGAQTAAVPDLSPDSRTGWNYCCAPSESA
jgi:hypothetical protein